MLDLTLCWKVGAQCKAEVAFLHPFWDQQFIFL